MNATPPTPRVGVVGAGVIAEQYLATFAAHGIPVVAIGDLDVERAKALAARHGIVFAGTGDAVIAQPDVDAVVNLTVPAAHAAVTRAAIAAGRAVWSEKPIALTRADAAAVLAEAEEAGVPVGVAPDTMLGPGIASALASVHDGLVGRPLSAIAAIQNPGPERWHPDPAFFYRRGAGPVLDMGPYYVTALAHVFGPAVEVTATGNRALEERVVHTGPKAGERVPVEVLTNVAAIIRYATGAHAQFTASFDSGLRRAGFLEITGTTGTLAFPDPNLFDGTHRLIRAGEGDGTVVAATPGPSGRGIGLLDVLRSAATGSPSRVSASIAAHVLDVLLAIEESALDARTVPIGSTLGTDVAELWGTPPAT